MILYKDNVERIAESEADIARLKEKGFRPKYIPKPVTQTEAKPAEPKPVAEEPVAKPTFRKRPARRTKAEG